MSLRLAALALLAIGCGGEPARFAYFKVRVSLDMATVDEDHRREIIGCGVKVSGATNDSFNLPAPCTKGSVPYEIPPFEYSTIVQKGEVVFAVNLSNISRKTVASGMSDPLPITPDQTVEGTVVCKGVPAPDGGAPDGDEPDGS